VKLGNGTPGVGNAFRLLGEGGFGERLVHISILAHRVFKRLVLSLKQLILSWAPCGVLLNRRTLFIVQHGTTMCTAYKTLGHRSYLHLAAGLLTFISRHSGIAVATHDMKRV